jgi:hypothetical protein
MHIHTRMHQLKDLWNTIYTSQGSVASYVMKEKNDLWGVVCDILGF